MGTEASLSPNVSPPPREVSGPGGGTVKLPQESAFPLRGPAAAVTCQCVHPGFESEGHRFESRTHLFIAVRIWARDLMQALVSVFLGDDLIYLMRLS